MGEFSVVFCMSEQLMNRDVDYLFKDTGVANSFGTYR